MCYIYAYVVGEIAIKLAILVPCFAILVFVFIMWHESYYTLIIRKLYFLVTGS